MGQLHDFVEARVAEDLATARQGLKAARGPGVATEHGWVDRLTAAMDKRELLEIATTADFEQRHDYASRIRRDLAVAYSWHPDYRGAWGD